MIEIQDVRFWQRVHKTDDCWLWNGAINGDGYGNLSRGLRTQKAHRYSWTLATGEHLTSHDTICHVCDTPACVRNDEIGTYRVGINVYPRRGHLYKATQPANVTDRDAKGRGNWAKGEEHGTHTKPETVQRGESHAHAKLTDKAVRVIRATYTGKYGELASMARTFGVTAQTIRTALKGTWQHVNGIAEPIVVMKLPKARGVAHSQAKLTEQQVIDIRSRAANGETQRSLASEYGISVASASLIVARKTWQHLP